MNPRSGKSKIDPIDLANFDAHGAKNGWTVVGQVHSEDDGEGIWMMRRMGILIVHQKNLISPSSIVQYCTE